MKKMNSLIIFNAESITSKKLVCFLLRKDKKDQFFFAVDKSNLSEILMNRNNIKTPLIKSVILVSGDDIYTGNEALGKIFLKVGGGWSLLGLLNIVPKNLKHHIYSVCFNIRCAFLFEANIHQTLFLENNLRFLH